jgi:hypothetical protein
MGAADALPPRLTLIGDADVYVPLYGSYSELGALAVDDPEGTLASDLIVRQLVLKDEPLPKYCCVTDFPIDTSKVTDPDKPFTITYGARRGACGACVRGGRGIGGRAGSLRGKGRVWLAVTWLACGLRACRCVRLRVERGAHGVAARARGRHVRQGHGRARAHVPRHQAVLRAGRHVRQRAALRRAAWPQHADHVHHRRLAAAHRALQHLQPARQGHHRELALRAAAPPGILPFHSAHIEPHA